LTGNASTATLAASSTNIAGGANGSLPYQTGSGTTTFLAAGSNGQFLTLSGGVPTWSSLSYVSSFSAGTTGFTPNVSTTGAVTLSGTLNVANGGTGVTSSSGANSVVLRDANVNISANDFYEGFTNVAAAGTTITLTAASTPNFVITGSGGQTYKLPDATTIPTGAIYTFNNNQTSGAISVQNSSGTLVVSVPSGGFVEIILLTNSVAAGTWDYHFQAPSNVSWSTNTLSYAGSITNATWNGVSIGAIYGGTGQTSYTTGDTLYASASNTLSKLAIGSTGQVLTVSGGVPTWANTSSATTITDDTTTNATRYINFTSATSGSLTNIGTSSTKLQYNPSTGTITAPSITTTSDATIHGLTVGLGTNGVSGNTALGVSALNASNSGTGYNTAVGNQALLYNTSGSLNAALGASALFANTTGASNTALGTSSVQSNTTGSFNTAVGNQALQANTTASNNTAVGYQAAYANTTGQYVTSMGWKSLLSNTTGGNNVGLGDATLAANTTGGYNTAVGSNALNGNTTASNNTAVGYQAGYSNTTGGISALGTQAGYSNTTGTANIAIGGQALFTNSTSSYNLAIGGGALYNNTGGSNVGLGHQALAYNTTASNNTAVGYQAGYNNTTGAVNTFIGRLAAYACTTGSYNTCLGDETGNGSVNLTTGTNNVYIGYGTSGSGSSNTYEIVIGGQGSITGKGSGTGFIAPGSTATTGGGGVYQGNNSSSWSTTSDQRLKKNIVDNTVGLDAINQVRIRNFEYRLPNEVDPALKPTDAVNITGTQLGVIAQELQQVLPDCVKQESTGVLSVDTSNITWHLINAVKELTAEVNSLKQKVGA